MTIVSCVAHKEATRIIFKPQTNSNSMITNNPEDLKMLILERCEELDSIEQLLSEKEDLEQLFFSV